MSFVPAKQNFTIYPGATFYVELVFRVNGEPQDLTGYSASFVVKDQSGGGTVLSLTPSLGGEEATITVELDSTATAALSFDSGNYALVLTAPSDRTDVVLVGSIKVTDI